MRTRFNFAQFYVLVKKICNVKILYFRIVSIGSHCLFLNSFYSQMSSPNWLFSHKVHHLTINTNVYILASSLDIDQWEKSYKVLQCQDLLYAKALHLQNAAFYWWTAQSITYMYLIQLYSLVHLRILQKSIWFAKWKVPCLHLMFLRSKSIFLLRFNNFISNSC